MRDAGPTRRTVLAGLGALAALGLGLTACTSDDSSGPTPAQRKADDEIRKRAQASAVALLDRYDAVLAAHPALSGRLRPYSDEIALHLAAFGGTRQTLAPSSPKLEPVPAEQPAALADLARREQQGVDGRLVDLPAAGADLARLLASVAASQSVHARQLSTPA